MLSETEVELLRADLDARVRQVAADRAAHTVAQQDASSPSLLQLVMRVLHGEPSRFPTGRRSALRLQSQLTR